MRAWIVGGVTAVAVGLITKNIVAGASVGVIFGVAAISVYRTVFSHRGAFFAAVALLSVGALYATARINIEIPSGQAIAGARWHGLSDSTGVGQFDCGSSVAQTNWTDGDLALQAGGFEPFTLHYVWSQCHTDVKSNVFTTGALAGIGALLCWWAYREEGLFARLARPAGSR
jgi:hypothetical protein